VELPAFETILEDRRKLLEAHLILERGLLEGKGVVQKHGDRYVVQNAAQDYSPSDLDTSMIRITPACI